MTTSASRALRRQDYFGISSAGQLGHYWEVGEGTDTALVQSAGGTSVTVGTWRHVAMTRDVGAGTVRFFKEGVDVGQASTTTNPPFDGTDSWLTLMGNSFDTARGLDGSLDEVRIATDVKTPGWIALQVATLREQGVVRVDAVELHAP